LGSQTVRLKTRVDTRFVRSPSSRSDMLSPPLCEMRWPSRGRSFTRVNYWHPGRSDDHHPRHCSRYGHDGQWLHNSLKHEENEASVAGVDR
jgi:hypothetical protein